jgi:mersacidin/lichenicidin family type 2 lantibiotic
MSNVDIIRAWKDEEYRLSLTEEQLAALPPNPAGQIELAEADLVEVAGGMNKSGRGGQGGGTSGVAGCGGLGRFYCTALVSNCGGGVTRVPSGCGLVTGNCRI